MRIKTNWSEQTVQTEIRSEKKQVYYSICFFFFLMYYCIVNTNSSLLEQLWFYFRVLAFISFVVITYLTSSTRAAIPAARGAAAEVPV